ncbi:MAG: sulfotransferase, partial [Gammaproteobacteria bacterium]|nr:sulfotransferase [Gammaproteobacteria bacterium]
GLDRDEVDAAAEGAPTYSAFVSQLYKRRAALQGKQFSGEKTPDYCRYMPTLASLFPDARFIHIVRDGRNTALSTLKWAKPDKGPGRWPWWDSDALACCALWWTWQTWQGIRDGRALSPGRYHELRYEDLVERPAQHLQAMSDFLGLEYSDEMANFHRGKTVDNPALSAKSAWKPATKGLRDWREQMAPDDQAVFQALAGELLELLAYPATQQGANTAVEARVVQARSFWASARQSRDVADLIK